MPGLIESPPYTTSKAELCAQHQRMDDAFDGAEWELQNATDFEGYQLIRNTSLGPVRTIQVEATLTTPGVVIVFGFERAGGEEKVLLLEAWLPEEEDDP